eukprot:scaffold8509_cov296-Pinguiococcus_pyrenoidosus.AAC.2
MYEQRPPRIASRDCLPQLPRVFPHVAHVAVPGLRKGTFHRGRHVRDHRVDEAAGMAEEGPADKAQQGSGVQI